MQYQVFPINGKMKKAFKKHGKWYVQKRVDLPLEWVAKWEIKVREVGLPSEDYAFELLADYFTNKANGCPQQPNVKVAGALFERNAINFVRETIDRIAKDFNITELREICSKN